MKFIIVSYDQYSDSHQARQLFHDGHLGESKIVDFYCDGTVSSETNQDRKKLIGKTVECDDISPASYIAINPRLVDK